MDLISRIFLTFYSVQVTGICSLTALSGLNSDPEVVGSPSLNWDPIFDHLPDSYLDVLDAGGLVDQHLSTIKQEMVADELEGVCDQETVVGVAVDLGDTVVKTEEVKEEAGGYSSGE